MRPKQSADYKMNYRRSEIQNPPDVVPKWSRVIRHSDQQIFPMRLAGVGERFIVYDNDKITYDGYLDEGVIIIAYQSGPSYCKNKELFWQQHSLVEESDKS